MKKYLQTILKDKKVLILGFGREGRSTLDLVLESLPDADITIGDSNAEMLSKESIIEKFKLKTLTGNDYLNHINEYDVIIKSPGISIDTRVIKVDSSKITSQTDLFLSVYHSQVVGITGTKGKSTTSSLIYHIFTRYTSDVVLGGNIGTPLFSLIDQIGPETRIVCEFSSHQLEYISKAPRIGVLLNIYEEHLDHYQSYYHYQRAKYNIAAKQDNEDNFIYPSNDLLIKSLVEKLPPESKLLPFQNGLFEGDGIGVKGNYIVLRKDGILHEILPVDFSSKLIGIHNRQNALVAAAVALLSNIPIDKIEEGISSFNPLEHRLEMLGTFNGITYYNDSISTIPEAAIAAVESVKPVDTLILGGFDRGIDYKGFAQYLINSNVENIVCTGPAGKRIIEELRNLGVTSQLHFFESFDEAVAKAMKITSIGGVCLLSPAASSYNEFKDFTFRGNRFKQLVSKV